MGRCVRHEPVWLSLLVPTSSVMAKGCFTSALCLDEAVVPDVSVCDRLQHGDARVLTTIVQQVRKAALELEIFDDRRRAADFSHLCQVAAFRFEDRIEPSLD